MYLIQQTNHYHLQKMTNIDWLVLILTLGGIVGFGFWKGRVSKQDRKSVV